MLKIKYICESDKKALNKYFHKILFFDETHCGIYLEVDKQLLCLYENRIFLSYVQGSILNFSRVKWNTLYAALRDFSHLF